MGKIPKIGDKVVSLSSGEIGECIINAREDDHFLRISGGEILVQWPSRKVTKEVWKCDVDFA